jgi:hypothetical protein
LHTIYACFAGTFGLSSRRHGFEFRWGHHSFSLHSGTSSRLQRADCDAAMVPPRDYFKPRHRRSMSTGPHPHPLRRVAEAQAVWRRPILPSQNGGQCRGMQSTGNPGSRIQAPIMGSPVRTPPSRSVDSVDPCGRERPRQACWRFCSPPSTVPTSGRSDLTVLQSLRFFTASMLDAVSRDGPR